MIKAIVLLAVVAFAAADDITFYSGSADCTGDATATFTTSITCASKSGISACVSGTEDNQCIAANSDAMWSITTICSSGSSSGVNLNSFSMTVYNTKDCSGPSTTIAASSTAAPSATCNAGASSGSFRGALTCSGCFTGEGKVTRPDGSEASIKDVNVDDYVLAARPDGTLFFDKVFRITHFSPDASTPALKVVTKSGKMLELTEQHYLHAGACCDPDQLTLAKDLKVGDTVFVAPASVEATGLRAQSMVADEVASIEKTMSKGDYNVHTLSSNIVVNGVAASHFTAFTTWSAGSRSLAPMWYKTLDFFTTAENAKLR